MLFSFINIQREVVYNFMFIKRITSSCFLPLKGLLDPFFNTIILQVKEDILCKTIHGNLPSRVCVRLVPSVGWSTWRFSCRYLEICYLNLRWTVPCFQSSCLNTVSWQQPVAWEGKVQRWDSGHNSPNIRTEIEVLWLWEEELWFSFHLYREREDLQD